MPKGRKAQRVTIPVIPIPKDAKEQSAEGLSDAQKQSAEGLFTPPPTDPHVPPTDPHVPPTDPHVPPTDPHVPSNLGHIRNGRSVHVEKTRAAEEEATMEVAQALSYDSEIDSPHTVIRLKNPHADLIATIPEELQFFLNSELDLSKRPCTKGTFLQIVQHFFPSYKPKLGARRPAYVDAYTTKVKPLITAHLESLETCKSSDQDDQMEEATKELDLSGINPTNPNITIDIIVCIISELHPKVVLPRKMKKIEAIANFYQYVAPCPPGGHPPAFTTPHVLVPVPYHTQLTKEELRFGLHCHARVVHVPEGINKDHLEGIYVQFALNDIHEGVPVLEGIHYFIVAPVEN
jgi:hypothetical protein